jgi:hypothetical protein
VPATIHLISRWQTRANIPVPIKNMVLNDCRGGLAKNVRAVAAVDGSSRSRKTAKSLERRLTKDDLSAERQALEHAKSILIESAATEVVSIGRVLFKDGRGRSTLALRANRGRRWPLPRWRSNGPKKNTRHRQSPRGHLTGGGNDVIGCNKVTATASRVPATSGCPTSTGRCRVGWGAPFQKFNLDQLERSQ